jgi:hypothetical protein
MAEEEQQAPATGGFRQDSAPPAGTSFPAPEETSEWSARVASAPPRSETGETAGGSSPADAQRIGEEQAGNDRPEIAAAGAFVGAFVLAKVLKRLGGSD